jgi:plastocyanin
MRRLLVPVTLVLAVAVAVPAAAAATSETIAITKSGFTPRTTTLAFGSKVTWRNDDSSDHQVVANDGSFASPVLGHGKTYAFTFTHAGTFHYHDALHPVLKATITIKGPPPSLALALDKPIVTYGTQVMLSGKAANVKPGTTVTLFAQPWGQPSPVELAVVQAGTDGSFGYLTTPHLYTTYTASMQASTGTVQSAPVIAQVAPRVQLVPGRRGWMHVQVTAGKSLWHRHVFLQRLSAFGQWVNLVSLPLNRASGSLFRPTLHLPRGASRIRISLSVNEAGIGLLGAHSGTQLVRRR